MLYGERLRGVHPDLCRVILLADTLTPIFVIEGLRSAARQQQLFREGKTRTLNSRHLTGHAVDIAPHDKGKIVWDFALFERLSHTVLECAQELHVPIVWGGSWKSFKDGPHYQLDEKVYPARADATRKQVLAA